MLGDKVKKIKSFSPSEIEVLHVLFRDTDFNLNQYAKSQDRSPKTIRTYLSTILRDLGVPKNIPENEKRVWAVREYKEAYQYVFKIEEWEAEQAIKRASETPKKKAPEPQNNPQEIPETPIIFKKPPDPISIEYFKPPPPLEDDAIIPANHPIFQQRQNNGHPLLLGTGIGFIVSLVIFLVLIMIVVALYENRFNQMANDAEIQQKLVDAQNITINDLNKKAKFFESFTQVSVLFANMFDGQLPTDAVFYGTPKIEKGYLYPNDQKLEIKLGDDSWVNYIILFQVHVNACRLESGDGNRDSSILVRSKDHYYTATSWQACATQQNYFKKYVIIVKDNKVFISYDGALKESKDITDPDLSRGGVLIKLDKASELDYLIVLGIP